MVQIMQEMMPNATVAEVVVVLADISVWVL
jgi:hypothetical protein